MPNMSTYLFSLFLIHLISVAGAQEQPSPNGDSGSSFEPNLAVIISVLAIMFSVTFILLVYAKFCHRSPAPALSTAALFSAMDRRGIFSSSTRVSGVDKTVIESLPFFLFSSLRGAKKGLECAVCLSKFEEIEILRLLPKCKHAFHINCVDRWLESHSTCPLCRQIVNADDIAIFANSNSFRFVGSQLELRVDSNLELFVEREQEQRLPNDSSRIGSSIGNSFRRILRAKKEEEAPIRGDIEDEEELRALHKFNHKIVFSDMVFKHRWSNVSSSDMIFLNSEMINAISSDRFSSIPESRVKHSDVSGIKEELDRKRLLEQKVSQIKRSNSSSSSLSISALPPHPPHPPPPPHDDASDLTKKSNSPAVEKRSMSEITVFSRFRDLGMTKNSKVKQGLGLDQKNGGEEEERKRRIWFPIARRTVEWYANNRQNRSQQPPPQDTRQRLDV
ncbi:hypothetical protein Ancab_028599 [Ancistrocladus abbreviatus]